MKNVEDMTRDELRAEAKQLQIPGRGSMKVAELRTAVTEARSATSTEPTQVQRAFHDEDGWKDLGRILKGTTVESQHRMENVGYVKPGQYGGLHIGPGQVFMAPLPPKRDRYRDRIKRGELVVRTPNGQAPAMFRKVAA